MLVFFLIGLLIVLYISFYWRSPNLYSYSRQVSGPFCLPFIGVGYKFIGSQTVVFKRIMNTFDNYPNLVKVWLGPYLLYGVTKPEYLEKILTNPVALERFLLLKAIRPLLGDGLISTLVPDWRRHRRVIAPTFNSKVLSKFIGIYARNSDILVGKLENLPKNTIIDMFALATNCTLDIISESLFGTQINAQINNTTCGLLFSKWIDIYFIRVFKVWYYNDFLFNFSKYHKQQVEYIEEIRKLAKMIFQTKQEELQNRSKQTNINDEKDDRWKPLLEHLLDFKKHDLSYQEIEDELITFMVAGSDTSATVLCFSMILLGIDQDIQERLYNEVIDVLGHDRPVENDDLPNLKLTERVIKETLRLFPPVAFVGRHLIQDLPLDDGITLPKGSQVVLGHFHVHRNEKYWPDSLKFDPDRFLPEEIAKRHPFTYVPFSYGLRDCIGGKLAMMLLKTVLPTIVRRFKIKTDYKKVEDIELRASVVIQPKDGYKISLMSR